MLAIQAAIASSRNLLVSVQYVGMDAELCSQGVALALIRRTLVLFQMEKEEELEAVAGKVYHSSVGNPAWNSDHAGIAQMESRTAVVDGFAEKSRDSRVKRLRNMWSRVWPIQTWWELSSSIHPEIGIGAILDGSLLMAKDLRAQNQRPG